MKGNDNEQGGIKLNLKKMNEIIIFKTNFIIILKFNLYLNFTNLRF